VDLTNDRGQWRSFIRTHRRKLASVRNWWCLRGVGYYECIRALYMHVSLCMHMYMYVCIYICMYYYDVCILDQVWPALHILASFIYQLLHPYLNLSDVKLLSPFILIAPIDSSRLTKEHLALSVANTGNTYSFTSHARFSVCRRRFNNVASRGWLRGRSFYSAFLGGQGDLSVQSEIHTHIYTVTTYIYI